jgi:hypothetical protein
VIQLLLKAFRDVIAAIRGGQLTVFELLIVITAFSIMSAILAAEWRAPATDRQPAPVVPVLPVWPVMPWPICPEHYGFPVRCRSDVCSCDCSHCAAADGTRSDAPALDAADKSDAVQSTPTADAQTHAGQDA